VLLGDNPFRAGVVKAEGDQPAQVQRCGSVNVFLPGAVDSRIGT
jgi:hypothetical protein